MRLSTDSGLPLAALLFVVVPATGWAHTSTKCPTEPAQHVPIVSGETYYDCTIYTTVDLDSFQFYATAGSNWSIVAGLGPPGMAGICLALYARGAILIFSGCTDIDAPVFAVATIQKLALAGLYTIEVSGESNAAVTYNLSLERLNPAPPDGVPLVPGRIVSSEVSPATAQDAFIFQACTSGVYQIALTVAPGGSDVCLAVYQPDGTAAAPGLCTNQGSGAISVQGDLVPTENGTYVVVVYTAGNDSTVDYNLEVACVAGNCSCGMGKCALDDTLSYASGTLTMNFTVETPYTATWNAWLVSGNTSELLWSQSQPITEPPAAVSKTQAVAASGKVGILSTLTTPARGIACSSWELIKTGTP